MTIMALNPNLETLAYDGRSFSRGRCWRDLHKAIYLGDYLQPSHYRGFSLLGICSKKGLEDYVPLSLLISTAVDAEVQLKYLDPESGTLILRPLTEFFENRFRHRLTYDHVRCTCDVKRNTYSI